MKILILLLKHFYFVVNIGVDWNWPVTQPALEVDLPELELVLTHITYDKEANAAVSSVRACVAREANEKSRWNAGLVGAGTR